MRPDRDVLLAELAAWAAGIHHGLAAFHIRLDELGGGIPSRSDGSGGGGSSPVETMVVERPRLDPSLHLAADFDRRLAKAHRDMLDLWESYASVASPRPGVEKLSDPGCELCAPVPGHWCPTYGSIEIVEPARRKGDKPRVRVLRLCQFCYQFNWPSRAGRLPLHEEVVAHSEGRRPRFTKGA